MYQRIILVAAVLVASQVLGAQALAIRTDELPAAIKGTLYEARIVTYTNGRCPLSDMALTLAGGQLPRGVELSTSGLEGTPEQIGHFRFAVRASNNCHRVTKTLDLVVNGRPILIASPGQITLHYRQGSADLPEEVVQIEGSWPDLPYSYAVSGAPWLKLDAAIGRTPDRESALTGDLVHFKVDPSNLAPGRYSGSVKFFTKGGENAPTVRVTLEVSSSE